MERTHHSMWREHTTQCGENTPLNVERTHHSMWREHITQCGENTPLNVERTRHSMWREHATQSRENTHSMYREHTLNVERTHHSMWREHTTQCGENTPLNVERAHTQWGQFRHTSLKLHVYRRFRVFCPDNNQLLAYT